MEHGESISISFLHHLLVYEIDIDRQPANGSLAPRQHHQSGICRRGQVSRLRTSRRRRRARGHGRYLWILKSLVLNGVACARARRRRTASSGSSKPGLSSPLRAVRRPAGGRTWVLWPAASWRLRRACMARLSRAGAAPPAAALARG